MTTKPKTRAVKASPFQRVNAKSMNELILRHLMPAAGGPGHISAIEAQALYRCRSLSRRICDLKAAGYDIVSVPKMDVNGQRYARYYLVGQKPVSYGQDLKTRQIGDKIEREKQPAPAAPIVVRVGKKYRARNGEVYGPMKTFHYPGFIQKVGDGFVWNADGTARHTPGAMSHTHKKSDFDLVAPVSPETR